MSESQTVTVRILDKDYHIACPESERANLERAGDYLDKKMRDIRRSGKVIGTERIAVMAALNITYELHNKQRDAAGDGESSEQVAQLLMRVQQSLGDSE
ncbi:cell division protein ZapA [Pseudomonas sp. C27(2019)]|uniref:cell division protein ZapA n=1 Tax=Pseudomonas sp. C27(2019) TaxID=2604941 RepID=UPI001245E47F|nr:cell division protein ZapA [Pseudomonas sp. C27(2019)]QEY60214.1 cell division protein ZapA [Pseudomonas sp. C27(2019)]